MQHSGQQLELSDEGLEAEIRRSSLPLIVELWAEWSGSCHIMRPILDSLSEAPTGRIRFVRIRIEDCPRTVNRYAVRAVPTLLLFRSGQLVDSVSGTWPRTELAKRVERSLDKAVDATYGESSTSCQ
jgi:thioredoxin-like negative regulator of GroEL